VLVVGLDGATNRVIDELFRAGALPNLAAIARDGVRGAVRPARPILSPRIWTTFATGLPANRHGVHGWSKLGRGNNARLYSNLDRRVPALWNIASAAGRRVGVVNWLMTQPPDRVNGVMISEHAVPGLTESRLPMAKDFAEEVFGTTVEEVVAPEVAIAYAWPPEWIGRSETIRAGALPPLTDVPNPFVASEGPTERLLHDTYQDDELTVHTALEVEARVRPDLLMVYLPGIDRVSHMLWQGIEVPRNPPPGVVIHGPAVRAEQREALFAYYRFTDGLLGHLTEGFGPEDFVFVISDHGFEANEAPNGVPGTHESDAARDGILYARGPGIAPGATATHVADLDLLPTLLAALGLPQARDLPGRVAPFLPDDLAPEPVATHADVSVERVETPASEVDDEILEKLRTLGYVE
jgi:hypothetical protein